MKARLLIGVAVCAAMLAVLATIGGVTKAHADDPGGLTCGGQVDSFNAHWDLVNQEWDFTVTHHCNLNKTYALELQYATSANPNQWHDFGNELIRSSGDCTNGCNPGYSNATVGCPSGQGSWRLRWHYWWSGGDRISNNWSTQLGCNGNHFTAP